MENIASDILVPISGERSTKTFEIRQASKNLKELFGKSKFQMCWMEPAAVMLAQHRNRNNIINLSNLKPFNLFN